MENDRCMYNLTNVGPLRYRLHHIKNFFFNFLFPNNKQKSMSNPQDDQPRTFRRVAVFCGASSGTSPVYIEAARALGHELVKRNIGLVYGGGNVGLMGAVAETVAQGLGQSAVIGVIPHSLIPKEISGTSVGEIRQVPDMHSRKSLMFREADAFISLPGGYGTLDETLEITTWQQLGFHTKPVGLLNINGFYDGLLSFINHASGEGFISPTCRSILLSESSPGKLLDALEGYKAPPSLLTVLSAKNRAQLALAEGLPADEDGK